jgi:putative drug exporter of the RND superfamily
MGLMDDVPSDSSADRFSRFVVSHAKLILVLWIAGAVLIRGTAPDWSSLALDGDFEYLPKNMASVAAERVLDVAFPADRPRSQIVIIQGRETGPFDDADALISLDLLRRLHHRMAEVLLTRAEAREDAAQPTNQLRRQLLLEQAQESLDEAIRIDEQYFDVLRKLPDLESIPPESIRLTLAYWDRANLLEQLGQANAAGPDRQAALILDPEISQRAVPVQQRDLAAWSSLQDLLGWNDRVLGSRLRHPRARLIVIHSDAELAATHNIDFLAAVQRLIADVRQVHQDVTRPGLEILATGSAAIGGETLTAARDSLRYTEWFTVLMVLLILSLVYRSPLLIAVPLVSIGLAVAVSTGVISWLTLGSREGWLPLDLRIFTTSRIFVFVILFGAGTDYCLFLIARLREEAAQWPWDVAVSKALSGVSEALLGSALTTVVGLAMLWIAQFGKFHYTGPIIAVCLLIGLFVCMTLTPAILRLLGPRVFWPSTVRVDDRSLSSLGQRAGSPPAGLWGLIALRLTNRPGLALVVGFGLLMIPAGYGYIHEQDVTYDISSQLAPSAESRRGFRMLSTHFGIGEVTPTTVLLIRPDAVSEATLNEDAKELSSALYSLEGVRAVRSADDPLGDFPPERAMGLLSAEAWKRRALRTHRIARGYFFSESPQYAGRLVRLDVVMSGDPFDIRTAENVTAMGDWIRTQTQQPDSPWQGAEVLLAGTTPSIIDLRSVTLQDHRRIKLAVVIAVFAVLLIIIRRVVLCAYLIVTVLLSYYATLGLTILFFRWAYGADYLGLDWKLPLFLFVILVAVGQDYNVYLVTRILQEQRQRSGWLSALRLAVARTGGIITACGLVMAGTFFSMTASGWLPALQSLFGVESAETQATLRGIVELGFALGLGVLLDTFYIRTILVPSFIALLDSGRSRARRLLQQAAV